MTADKFTGLGSLFRRARFFRAFFSLSLTHAIVELSRKGLAGESERFMALRLSLREERGRARIQKRCINITPFGPGKFQWKFELFVVTKKRERENYSLCCRCCWIFEGGGFLNLARVLEIGNVRVSRWEWLSR